MSLMLDMYGERLNISPGTASVGTNASADEMHIPAVMAVKVKKADDDDRTPRQVPARVCERHILCWSDAKRLFV